MKLVCDVAARLEADLGYPITVVSAHTLKPLDADGIGRLLETHRTVAVVEEHSCRGGLGERIKAIAWDRRASCELRTFGLKDEFIHIYGSQADVWRAHGLTGDALFDAIREAAPHGSTIGR